MNIKKYDNDLNYEPGDSYNEHIKIDQFANILSSKDIFLLVMKMKLYQKMKIIIIIVERNDDVRIIVDYEEDAINMLLKNE